MDWNNLNFAGDRSTLPAINVIENDNEYAIDVAKACAKRNIKSVAVTAGYISEEPRKEFFKYMDAANVDLKAFTDEFYWKLTGGHLQPVLDIVQRTGSIDYTRQQAEAEVSRAITALEAILQDLSMQP